MMAKEGQMGNVTDRQTEREKARNVTGPRNVTREGRERKKVPDTSRHQPISMDD